MNCYKILGIAQDADLREINSAYKKLALRYHPDKTGGDDVSMDEKFRKIQQAVETLRDPRRRQIHDEGLHSQLEISMFANPQYKGWRPQPYNRWFGPHSANDRYMFSYRNSVHMSPQEEDSVKERASSERMRKDYDEWRQSLFEQERMEQEQAKREDAMWAKFMCNEYKMQRGEVKDGLADGQSVGSSHVVREKAASADGIHTDETDNPSPERSDGSEQVLQKQGVRNADGDGLGDDHKENGPDDYRSVTSDSISFSEYETARESSSDDEAIFYDVSDFQEQVSHRATHHDNHSSTSPSEASAPTKSEAHLPEEPTSDRDTVDPLHSGPATRLAPFIPYFSEKLKDPYCRYSPDDLNVEIRGLVLETYCGWLEDVRLSVPGARPLETGLDPEQCSHLGFWEKKFVPIECEACHRWMPIYSLTCPGCGIKACVSCKFE
ncbi:hypothetical protein BDV59DRAFT_197150 [Aspergillus ambiguus]|uniref:DnaJ domain protein n=1 Tax=Aspergillus ambiguus TaxID=176160 RepID=UPI003CCDDAEA